MSGGSSPLSPVLCATPPGLIATVCTGPPLLASTPVMELVTPPAAVEIERHDRGEDVGEVGLDDVLRRRPMPACENTLTPE